MTDKDKEKKKPVKVTEDQIKRAKKVQKKGVSNKKATENSRGEVVPKANKALRKKLRIKRERLSKSQKGSPKYNKRKKEYDAVVRENRISDKSSKKAAEVGSAQKKTLQGEGAYQDRLRKQQANRKK